MGRIEKEAVLGLQMNLLRSTGRVPVGLDKNKVIQRVWAELTQWKKVWIHR